MVKKLGIIADNLIGSNDTGVQFSKYGLSTVVISEREKLNQYKNNATVISVNTNTRMLDAQEASKHVRNVTKILKNMGLNHFYKKIDSTLRGNIAVEIEAMMLELGLEMGILVPSFPANGRIVENGYLLTKRENNSLFPVCHVPSLLQNETDKPISLINLSDVRKGTKTLQQKLLNLMKLGTKIVVIDAVSEEDLFNIAIAIKDLTEMCVVAGSAGLASHLPFVLNLDKSLPLRKKRSVLVIAGTFNRITSDQIMEAKKLDNTRLIEFSTEAFVSGEAELEVKNVTRKAQEALVDNKIAIIALDTLIKDRKELEGYKISENVRRYGKKIADSLGAIAKELTMKGVVTDLVVTGGGTASHVVEIMGASFITLENELLPGIPSGKLQGGQCEGLRVVTKAGGFGSRDSLAKVIEYLRELKPYLINN
ncbi:MAG: D-threonate/D-erythronate kinase [Clostridia bacterium]|nr:D-threonate/D-erythronate kinase [Clostridia bacterium]